MYTNDTENDHHTQWKNYRYPRDGDETMDAPGQIRRTMIDLLRLGHHHGPAWRERLYESPAPELTDRPEWDALLAASAEHLAVIHGETPPEWTTDPRRSLQDPWWCWEGVVHLSEHERELQCAGAPRAFVVRNVIPDPRDFDPRTGEQGPRVPDGWAWMQSHDPGPSWAWPVRWAIAFEQAIQAVMPNRRDEKATVIAEHEGRRILGASVDFVCASKMRAARMKDVYDVQFVMGKTGWTWDDLRQIHDHAYAEGPEPAPGMAEALGRSEECIRAWETAGRRPAPEIRSETAQRRAGERSSRQG